MGLVVMSKASGLVAGESEHCDVRFQRFQRQIIKGSLEALSSLEIEGATGTPESLCTNLDGSVSKSAYSRKQK